MYTRRLNVIFMMVIQVLSRTMDVLGDFGVNTLISKVNETDLLHLLEKLKGHEIQIPEECKNKRFCEYIPNYPEEIMAKIIKMLAVPVVFDNHSAESSSHKHEYRKRCLCYSESTVNTPLAIPDETGRWILVLNSIVNPVQSYFGELCIDNHRSRCLTSNYQRGYKATCEQTYARRKIIVITSNMTIDVQSHPMPSCCMCVVRNYE